MVRRDVGGMDGQCEGDDRQEGQGFVHAAAACFDRARARAGIEGSVTADRAGACGGTAQGALRNIGCGDNQHADAAFDTVGAYDFAVFALAERDDIQIGLRGVLQDRCRLCRVGIHNLCF